MKVCKICRYGADKVRCAWEFQRSGYSGPLACEAEIERFSVSGGRHANDPLKADLVYTPLSGVLHLTHKLADRRVVP